MTFEFIFVYGTLRRKAASSMYQLLADHCEYFVDGYMQGRLYEVDGYPGAIESDNAEDKVYGELYRIVNKDLLFTQLDEYEECNDHFPEPYQYVRKKLSISLSASKSMVAWVYVFNHDVSKLRQIRSGDYLKKNRHAERG